jgi:hypothetical protein
MLRWLLKDMDPKMRVLELEKEVLSVKESVSYYIISLLKGSSSMLDGREFVLADGCVT